VPALGDQFQAPSQTSGKVVASLVVGLAFRAHYCRDWKLAHASLREGWISSAKCAVNQRGSSGVRKARRLGIHSFGGPGTDLLDQSQVSGFWAASKMERTNGSLRVQPKVKEFLPENCDDQYDVKNKLV
jgi:hypothetical protein